MPKLKEEVTDELEALKSIYEGSLQIIEHSSNGVEIVYRNERGLQVAIKITDNYPESAPEKITMHYKSVFDQSASNIIIEYAKENKGIPILYSLIAKAEDIHVIAGVGDEDISHPDCKHEKQNSEDQRLEHKKQDSDPVNHHEQQNSEDVPNTSGNTNKNEKSVCKFFKKGKCRFGDKCHNIHPGPTGYRRSGNEDKVVSKVEKYQAKSPKDDSENVTKKASMKTATDVIHRILWDDDLPTQNFIIGYLDRFIGIIEKPFSAFSWEDIASVDYNVLAVPKHRIQYFKYGDKIIWDKTKRLDKVFGSTGDNETIAEIIANTEIEEKSKKLKDTTRKEDSEKVYDDRNRPNYFLSFRITDSNILRKVKQAQDHIMSMDNRLTETSHDVDRLHVTLLMMRLITDEEKEKASAVLKSVEQLLPCLMPTNSFHIDVNYVGHFGRRVVYAGIRYNTELQKLVDLLSSKLKVAGIHLCGNFDTYTPHLTIFKLSRGFSRENEIKEINPFVFDKMKHMSFGNQRVHSLRICETGPERGADNFYITLANVRNHFLKISNQLPPLIAKNLNAQMSSGIIDEGDGDSLLADILSYDGERFEKATVTMETILCNATWKSDKTMITMRGLPGSGKSFLARKLNCAGKTKVICSADDYFEREWGPYQFSGAEIDKAHAHCRYQVIDAILKETDVVIIDNTHSQRWEYRVYERIAVLCGYKHFVLELACEKESTRQGYQKRCMHQVKEHIHQEMFMRWENDPQAITFCSHDLGNMDLDWILKDQARPVLYSALFLDKESRKILHNLHPATLQNQHADHMTIMYEPDPEHLKNLPVGTPLPIEIREYFGNSKAQVVVVSELESNLCTSYQPHVTIATSKSCRPGEVNDMLNSMQVTKKKPGEVLTGIVGVKIGISTSQSVQCMDPHYYRRFLAEYLSQSSSDSDEKVISEEQENESKGAGIYIGPDVVRSLNIFDFDSTLFFTPDPLEGRKKYQKLTGKPWPHKGWLGRCESLYQPLHVYPGPSLPDYRSHVYRAGSFNVLCTGRLERVRDGVESILSLHGLTFDRVILKPDDGQQFSSTNVKNYKKDVITNLLKEFPNVQQVNFWDDRISNIQAIKSLDRFNRKVKFNLHYIQDSKPASFYKLSTTELFARLGLLHDADYESAVTEFSTMLEKAWLDVLNVNENTQQLIHFFGSYLLKRKGDVDICLLAPTSMSPDACISKLAEKMRSYGLDYVHAAVGIRCPRLKLKVMYCDYSSICFDIVVACVLPDMKAEFDLDEVNPKKFKDKKNMIALDGLLFAKNEVYPILDRISETDFGMLIDAVVILLRRNHLKGNAFHCIRTFHLVKLLAEFIGNCPLGVLPSEGLDNLKDFEKFMKSTLRYFSSLSYEKLQYEFKGFVPDTYIQPILDCFAKASELSIEDILFHGSRLASLNNGSWIRLTLKTSSNVEQWKFMTVLEARAGSFVRQLIDRGFSITPGEVTDDLITFSVKSKENRAKELEDLVKQFVRDFMKESQNTSVKLTYQFNSN